MRAIVSAPSFAPPSTHHAFLPPSIQMLIDRGVLSRAIAEERPGEASAFVAQIRAAVSRGEVTSAQASTLRQMLGFRYAQPANDQSGRAH